MFWILQVVQSFKIIKFKINFKNIIIIYVLDTSSSLKF
jgi:hypothetical protein